MKKTNKTLCAGVMVCLLGFKAACEQELTATNHIAFKPDLSNVVLPPALAIKPAVTVSGQGRTSLLAQQPASVCTNGVFFVQQAGAPITTPAVLPLAKKNP